MKYKIASITIITMTFLFGTIAFAAPFNDQSQDSLSGNTVVANDIDNVLGENVQIEEQSVQMSRTNEVQVLYSGENMTSARDLMSAGFEQDMAEALEDIEEWTEPTTYWGYTNLGIANVENHLNVRETPDEEGKLIGKMSNNAACEILGIEGNWAHISSGELEGYVCLDYLLTGPMAIARAEEVVKPMAIVTADVLRVREQPNVDCEIITTVPHGEELEVLSVQGEWIEIDLDGESAYISAEYVSVEEKLSTAITMTELLYGEGVSDVRVDICQYAKQFVGNPYVWGGTSLTRGADCSGFVLSLYARYGISLPHSSRAQANCGRTVPLSQIQPGDLVFYTKGGTINHVAMYIGNGQVIHASNPTTGIRISGLYYRTPYKAVSLFD